MKQGYPDRNTAQKELEKAGTFNPGKWTDHSKYTALAAECIAKKIPEMDIDKAYVCGLLHDIGRRVGIVSERHLLEGYQYCMAQGWNEVAQICITHSFMIQDINTSMGKWDVTKEEYLFIEKFIHKAHYDEYDQLIQLCDSLAFSQGLCMLEKRFVDTSIRYGINQNTIPRWKKTFDIKKSFEDKMGCSIYDILPNVKESTFLEEK